MELGKALRLAGAARPAAPVPAPPEVIANWISNVLAPPVTTAAATALVCGHLGGAAAWRWGGLYILVAILAPAGYVLHLFRRGVVTDLHMNARSERTRPLVFTVAASAAAIGALSLGGAPQLLQLIAAVQLVQSLLFLAITLHWKVSAHTAAMAGLAVLAAALFSAAAAPVAAGLPLVAWARLYIRRHTGLQVTVGALLGGGLWTLALAATGLAT